MKCINTSAAWVTLIAIGFSTAGCADNSKSGDDGGRATPPAAVSNVDDHSGWWCKEHGIPEDQCSMCSAKVAAECRETGDWCEEHNRAASQCFVCDPSLADKFAKLYEAKYGTAPPARAE
jgi:hypothetical protein